MKFHHCRGGGCKISRELSSSVSAEDVVPLKIPIVQADALAPSPLLDGAAVPQLEEDVHSPPVEMFEGRLKNSEVLQNLD